ncbi:MAG: hypothetical protein PHU53_04035 [Thermoplasmata archaeon]|nr:hypothetical protein [Thermoplasmata archaeon]
MTDEIEMLARRLRETPNRPVSAPDLASELGLPEERVAHDMKSLMKRDGFFDLGNSRMMFTGNADLAGFEIFRNLASHISFEEYIQYRDQPHLLMRLSRDREVSCRSDPDKLLQQAIREKEKTRGSNVLEQ